MIHSRKYRVWSRKNRLAGTYLKSLRAWDYPNKLNKNEYVEGNTEDYSYGDTLYFIYDQNRRPFALLHNATIYYYILNAQGDVIYLVDETGSMAGYYTYDPYGKVIAESGFRDIWSWWRYKRV